MSKFVVSAKANKLIMALQFQDMEILEDCIVLRLHKSKTEKMEKGYLISLGICSIEGLCPVSAMKKYVAVQGLVEGDLFRQRDGAPLTKYPFQKITSLVFKEAGIE
ncbi:hypothetical protein JRQ81_019395, partial [Phrynocephalus forsythii]